MFKRQEVIKKYNIATDPITWLASRKYITEEQHNAGNTFLNFVIMPK